MSQSVEISLLNGDEVTQPGIYLCIPANYFLFERAYRVEIAENDGFLCYSHWDDRELYTVRSCGHKFFGPLQEFNK